jgi:hypothetical protein
MVATNPQTTNLIVNSGDAIKFDADNETWVIDANVTVMALGSGLSGGSGVWNNNHVNSTLQNSGSIYDVDPIGGFTAVEIDNNGGTATVLNEFGASIYGAAGGCLFLNGSGNDVVRNFGVIQGDVGIIFDDAPKSISVYNYGYIFGASAFGIWINTNANGAIITNNNNGTIASTTNAIFIETASSSITQITNALGGVIEGAVNAIVGSAGRFQLTNLGTIIGDIRDNDHLNDIITNRGHINGAIRLGGNSVYNGANGSSGPIHVGGGSATITAGRGADQFVFDAALTGQLTKITNFTPKQHDKIVLSEADFHKIGPHGVLTGNYFDNGAATHAHPEIVYTRSNGFLYYDSNGDHSGGLHHFATLASLPFLTNASFVVEA